MKGERPMQVGDDVVCPDGRARVVSVSPSPFDEIWVELKNGIIRWYASKNVSLYIFPNEQ